MVPTFIMEESTKFQLEVCENKNVGLFPIVGVGPQVIRSALVLRVPYSLYWTGSHT